MAKDVITAFKTNEGLCKYFSKVYEGFKAEENVLYNDLLENIQFKFDQMMQDDPVDNEREEFLVPELPKYRGKHKRTSRDTTRSKTSSVSTASVRSSVASSGSGDDVVDTRRSSRIASKTITRTEGFAGFAVSVPKITVMNGTYIKTESKTDISSVASSSSTSTDSKRTNSDSPAPKRPCPVKIEPPVENVIKRSTRIAAKKKVSPPEIKSKTVGKNTERITDNGDFAQNENRQDLVDKLKNPPLDTKENAVPIKLKQGAIPKLITNQSNNKRDRSKSEPSSPILPPPKVQCVDLPDLRPGSINKRSLDSSICSFRMKNPIGCSTPTAETCVNNNKPQQTLNVFKKYLTPTPCHTPIKGNLDSGMRPKAILYTEDPGSATKGLRCTRSVANKLVQQKNELMVKISEDKCQEAQKKKETRMKMTAEEARRRREEREHKVRVAKEEKDRKAKEELERKVKEELDRKAKEELERKAKEDLERKAKSKEEKERRAKEEKERKAKEEKERKAKEKLRLTGQKDIRSSSQVIPKNFVKKTVAAIEKKNQDTYEEYPIDHVSDEASSDEEDKPKQKVPLWATKEHRSRPLKIQYWLNTEKQVRPWFFSETLKRPKVHVLFPKTVKSRQRTSSAFWSSMIYDEAFPIHDE